MSEKHDYPTVFSGQLPQIPGARPGWIDLPSEEEEIDLLQYWRVIRKHLWGILGLALSVSVLAYLILLSMTPIYRATATLIIEPKQQRVVNVQDLYETELRSYQADYYQTQFEILKSRSLARKVIEALKLSEHPEFKPEEEPSEGETTAGGEDFHLSWRDWLPIYTPELPSPRMVDPDPIEELVDEFQKRLTIAPVRNTQLVKISFDAASPELAMQVTNALCQAYIDSNLDARSESTKLASSWLSSRLEGLRKKLADSERRLHAYLEKEGLVNVGGGKAGADQVSGVLSLSTSQLSDLTAKHIEARRQRLEAETQYAQVSGFGANLSERVEAVPAVFNDPMVQKLKQEEHEAQAKVTELSQRYGAQHPERVAAESHLQSVRSSLRKQIASVVSGIKNQLDAARANEAALSRQIEAVKSEIQGIARKEGQLKELEREVESNRNLYEMFFNRLRETSEAGDLQPSNARIVDPAPLPVIPFKPNKKLGSLTAFVLSLFAGVGFAFLIEYLDKSFKGAEDVEQKLGVPVLGLLPLLKNRVKEGESVSKIYLEDPQSNFAESVRTVRTSLMLSALDDPRMNILVTSSVTGEGKSSLSMSLAYSIAQLHSRVLLVEADLRRPNLAKHLGLPRNLPGLSNLVAHTARLEECVHPVADGKFDVLPAGLIPPNPLELISSQRFAEVLSQLENDYDAIILDAPPMQPVSDALALSRFARSVIYVVQAEKTPVHVVRTGIERLRKAKAPLTGVVLNRLDVEKGQRYYGDYYYAGYYYGGDSYATPSKKA